MPSFKSFELNWKTPTKCGIVEDRTAVDKDGMPLFDNKTRLPVIWRAYFLEGKDYPFEVMHVFPSINNSALDAEYWVDKNSDGRPELFFADTLHFRQQFEGFCEVLGK
jgi:hypothetical protein